MYDYKKPNDKLAKRIQKLSRQQSSLEKQHFCNFAFERDDGGTFKIKVYPLPEKKY